MERKPTPSEMLSDALASGTERNAKHERAAEVTLLHRQWVELEHASQRIVRNSAAAVRKYRELQGRATVAYRAYLRAKYGVSSAFALMG